MLSHNTDFLQQSHCNGRKTVRRVFQKTDRDLTSTHEKPMMQNVCIMIYRITEYKPRQQTIAEITEYIEIFYNRQRKQEKLGYLSPVQFSQQYYANLRTA
ncbi:IS3 family transposase [Nitrosomonas sp. PY1]|uniref:IS3 family transposase n=1 Tax=Nitrosomonas sp. PY1 TaxID=1803906 RepID=UPI00283A8D65|nr:IS3 family transposase [Nitrosomonas sp. PY1]